MLKKNINNEILVDLGAVYHEMVEQTINLAIQKLPFELCKVLVTFKSIKAIWPIATPKSFHLAPATFQLPSKALKCLCLL